MEKAQIPNTLVEGIINIDGPNLKCAVLDTTEEMRMITQADFLRTIGRSRQTNRGGGANKPVFLRAKILQPFITDNVRALAAPIKYRTLNGRIVVGYNALCLSGVIQVYLDLERHCYVNNKEIPRGYAHIIGTCDILSRSLRDSGIIGLIDEATGYEHLRIKSLQEQHHHFVSSHASAWKKQYQDSFYIELCRIYGWEWRPEEGRKPIAMAQITNRDVYKRIAPGLLDHLRLINPRGENGRRKVDHCQLLTDKYGKPALCNHLYAITAIARTCATKEDYKSKIEMAFPIKDQHSLLL